MECRTSTLLALCLMVAGAGCEGMTSVLAPAAESSSSTAMSTPFTTGKKKPKPETLVALGDYRETQATQPGQSPQEQQQLHDEARAAYKEALRINPRYLPAYTSLARQHTALREHDKALEIYQKALKLYPKEAPLWFELGVCYTQHHQWDPALESLREAVTLDPDNRQYATTFGYSLARAGHFEDSVAVFTKLDGKALANYKVARMAHHLKQEELSKELLRRALLEKPDLNEAAGMLQTLEDRTPAPSTLRTRLER